MKPLRLVTGGKMSTGHAIAGVHKPTSALDDLLTVEQEIAQSLADAEREAEALLATARADAGTIERDAATVLALELAGLDARARAECDALTRSIEDDAARLVKRYRALDDATIVRLAADVAAKVAGLATEPAP